METYDQNRTLKPASARTVSLPLLHCSLISASVGADVEYADGGKEPDFDDADDDDDGDDDDGCADVENGADAAAGACYGSFSPL